MLVASATNTKSRIATSGNPLATRSHSVAGSTAPRVAVSDAEQAARLHEPSRRRVKSRSVTRPLIGAVSASARTPSPFTSPTASSAARRRRAAWARNAPCPPRTPRNQHGWPPTRHADHTHAALRRAVFPFRSYLTSARALLRARSLEGPGTGTLEACRPYDPGLRGFFGSRRRLGACQRAVIPRGAQSGRPVPSTS